MTRLLLTIFISLSLVNCGGGTSQQENSLNAVEGRIPVTSHSSDGFYSVDLTIGGKPFRNLLVDTGSSNLIVFGDTSVCPTCLKPESYNTSPNFAIDTYSPKSAPLFDGALFTIEYGDGSPPQRGSARMYVDNINFSGQEANPVDYPLGVFVEGTRVQNILGLAFPSLLQSIDESTPLPFLDQYVKSNNLEDIFSLNLCAEASGAHFMTIGHIDYGVDSKAIRYTRILRDTLLTTPDYDFYEVAPTTLGIAGESSALGRFPTQAERYFTIIDSGTSLMFLPPALLSALASYYASTLNIPTKFWDLPDDLTQIEFIDPSFQSQLKDLVISFPDVTGSTIEYKISPKTYTLRVLKNDGSVGLISLLKSSHPPESTSTGFYPGVIVLGDVFMENAYTVFDRKSHQIGFLPNQTLCGSSSQSGVSDISSQLGRLQPRSLMRREIITRQQ